MSAPSANRLCKSIANLIDDYWMGKITKVQLQSKISDIFNNPELRIKIRKGDKYTGTFINIMGKKRIEEMESLFSSK